MKNMRNRSMTALVRTMRNLCAALFACSLLSASVCSAASFPAATVAAVVTGQGDFGTIKGKLVWAGATVPEPTVDVEQGKAKDSICAKDGSILSKELVIDPKTKGVANGIAFLVRPKGANPAKVADLLKKAPEVVIDQKNCEFLPRVSAIHEKQAVVFKSSDPTGHNVHYSAFKNDAFNQTVPPNSSVTRNLVAERIPIPVVCDIHPWMKSHIMVFDHPFFAVTKADGSFEIEGVPAGDYKFVLWHEKIGYVTPNKLAGQAITVDPGKALNLGQISMGK